MLYSADLSLARSALNLVGALLVGQFLPAVVLEIMRVERALIIVAARLAVALVERGRGLAALRTDEWLRAHV
jgi:hypothetical protein